MLNRIYHLGYAVEDIEAASRSVQETFEPTNYRRHALAPLQFLIRLVVDSEFSPVPNLLLQRRRVLYERQETSFW